MTKKRSTGKPSQNRRWIAALLMTSVGCGALDRVKPGPHDVKTSYHDSYGLNIEYPEVAQCATATSTAAQSAIAPLALEDPSQIPAFDMTLEEAVRMAVAQSPVLRNIGGTIVSAPGAAQTIYDPAIIASSTNQGTEAALSAFDANWSQQLFWSNADQPSNRRPFIIPGVGGGPPLIFANFNKSRNATFINELSKQSATGARFAIRNNVGYNKTQDPSFQQLLFPSTFDGFLEAEFRQPLMQGSGTQFNRIVGPSALPGQYNGVLIARINEDLSLTEFESSIITLVNDVEQAYWNLSNAYRALEATVKGREAAQQTFQFQQIRLEVGTGRADEEAQARSQYFQFQAQVESALGGPTGLYALEQRLRYLIGMAATDGRLIRPSTAPNDIEVVFDWDSAVSQALSRRVEIRRQKYNVKRRELELIAAKLNRRPRMDLLAQYRWRGLGDHLVGSSDEELDDLFGSITSGNFQEAQLGVEFNMPVGLRLASLAVRSANLNLKREHALLNESELRVTHDLSDAARQIELTYQLLETNYNRYQADLKQVEVLRRRYQDGNDNINFLLQAQRQVVSSEIAFYQSLADYNLAVRDFHRQKGSLLAYNQIQLSEGEWAPGAGSDAYTVGRFLQPRPNPDMVTAPAPLTSGPFDPSAIQPTTSRPAAAGKTTDGGGQTKDQAGPKKDEKGFEEPGKDEEVPQAPKRPGSKADSKLKPESDLKSGAKPNSKSGSNPKGLKDAAEKGLEDV
jgi:outer membrane protein TolC